MREEGEEEEREAEAKQYQIDRSTLRPPVVMECVACMEVTKSRVIPCGHPLCDVCARRWMEFGKRTCPTCRQPFVTLSSFTSTPPLRGETLVTIHFAEVDDVHVGITLETRVSSRVVVKRVERNDMAYRHGIRVNQVITRINSITVSDHETAIAVIEAAREASVPLTFHVQRPRRFYDMFRRLINVAHRHGTV